MSTSNDVKTLSVLPGRIRWQTQQLLGNPEAAHQVEASLVALDGTLTVKANPVTGRVLVQHHLSMSTEEVEKALIHALEKLACEVVEVVEKGAKALIPYSWAAGVASVAVVGVAGQLGVLGSLALATVGAAGWFVARKIRRRLAHKGLLRTADLGSVASTVAPYRKRLLLAVALDLGAGIFAVARFFFLGMAINAAYSGVGFQIGTLALGAVGATTLALVGTLASIVLRTGLKHRADLVWGYATAELQHDLRMQIYDHLQRLELDTILDTGQEQLLRIASDDVNQVDKALSGVWNLIDITLYTATMLVGIILISPQTTWLVLVPLPIIAAMSLILGPKARLAYRKLRKEIGRLTRELRQGIDGVATIKSFTAEDPERRRIEAKSQEYEQASKKAVLAGSSFPILLELLVLSSTSWIYVLSVRLNANVVSSFSTIVTLNQLIAHSIYNLTRIGPHVETVERGLASFDRIRQLLELEPALDVSAQDPRLLQPVLGEVEYKQVSFSYPTSDLVFDDLTLHFAPRRTTAIVGLSGSGKSTLISLLLRFYSPDEGFIELDGVNIKEISRADLRRQIAVVSQDIFLFNRSIAENIRLGKSDASDEEVVEAARRAQADGFIRKLHEGYDTVLGEHGKNLSGGERQRIAIARALLKDAPIFVFDEPTSHLDAYTEGKFLEDLWPLMSGRTMILITHRMSTAQNADYIYNIDNGTVLLEGTHQELEDAARTKIESLEVTN